jgi:hypothetical protein
VSVVSVSAQIRASDNPKDVSSLRYRAGCLSPILLHRAIDFALGIAIALGIALVVLFLSFCQTDFAFDAATLRY